MAKILKVSFMRYLAEQVSRGKITYGRMLELIEAKILSECETQKDHISKADLLAHIETNSDVMKEIAYNEDIEISERKQAYDRFAALEWLKDWVPHLANLSNAENGHIESEISEAARIQLANEMSDAARNVGQHKNMANEMIAAQSQPSSIECLSCGHEWNIEMPALYKETFCPKCGE